MSKWDVVDLSSMTKLKPIKSMRDGEYGWTVPWAVSIHKQKAYIDLNYTVTHNILGDTSELLVMRDNGVYYAILFNIDGIMYDYGCDTAHFISCKFATYDKITQDHIRQLSSELQSLLRSVIK